MRRALARPAVLVLLGLLTLPAGAHAARIEHFWSPTRNLACEMTKRHVFCTVLSRREHGKLRRDGTVVRSPQRADPPIGARTLRYGRRVNVGRFRCTSKRRGMKCVVRRSGRGFLASRDGFERVRSR